VNVVAGVAELCDLLGQEFHSLGRVAEDDALKQEQRYEKNPCRLPVRLASSIKGKLVFVQGLNSHHNHDKFKTMGLQRQCWRAQ
jgi:hypothetical protein